MGVLVAVSSVRFVANGWVDRLYLEPTHHLTFPGFEWVRPWPRWAMFTHMAALALAGLTLAAGFRTRISAAAVAVLFSMLELIDAALYLNHYWFLILVAVWLAVLPTEGAAVMVGVIWLLRAQIGVVYLFAGLAKLNADWLVRGQPMTLWFADRSDLPIVGMLLAQPSAGLVASWAGAVFDCTIVIWLLWRRSRPVAYAVLVVFHLVTGWLFPIGLFPWVMIAATLVFFEPDWPDRAARGLRLPSQPARFARHDSSSLGQPRGVGPTSVVMIAMLVTVNLVLPLRHYANDGNVRWTEEGYYLAWRVMLTEKTGHLAFRVTDHRTGVTTTTDASDLLADWQLTQASIRPDLIRSTALLIADSAGGSDVVAVRADSFVSMNGRTAHRMIDPTVDLVARDLEDGWILDPDEEPLFADS